MLAYLIIWRLVPLLYTIFLSFNDWNIVRQKGPQFAGLANYSGLISDGRFHDAMWFSILFMFLATAIETVIGTALAIATDRHFKGKDVVQGTLLLPMFLTPVAVGTIWYILFEPVIGPINYLLALLGLPAPNWLGDQSIALWSIIISDIWQWTPFVYLLVLSALQGVPMDVIEAAKIDGARDYQIIRRVTLPLIKGTILVAALLRAMEAFRVFPKIYVMTGGGPGRATESGSILIYKTAFRFFEMGYAASMTIIMLILLIMIYGYYLKIVRRAAVTY
jgi:multiple sugar transport system permease protein